VKDLPGQGGRKGTVERGVQHVGGHERRDPRACGAPEREQLPAEKRLPSRADDRKRFVGVDGGIPVSREMLPYREDSPGERPSRECDPESGCGFGVPGEGAVPDHGVFGVAVHVEYRREVHVDPDRSEFGGGRGAHALGDGFVPAAEEGTGAGRGKAGERGFPEPRHAAPLLVDGDQRERVAAARGGPDLAAQTADLGGGIDVPREQDDAADLPAGEPPRKRFGERLPFEADPEGGGDGVGALHETECITGS
jgi:hypothetical protein